MEETSQATLNLALQSLAEIEARIALSDRKRIDLLSYTDVAHVEDERFALDVARAELKVALKNSAFYHSTQEGNPDFNKDLEFLQCARESELYGRDSENQKKDKLFRRLKNRRAVTRGLFTSTIGVAIGTGAHESAAAVTDTDFGLVDTLRGETAKPFGEKFTALTWAYKFLTDTLPYVNQADVQAQEFGDGQFLLPKGTQLVESDGAYSLMYGGDDGAIIADGLTMDADGTFDAKSTAILEEVGIHPTETSIYETVKTSEERTLGVEEWAKASGAVPVEHVWLHNDTAAFDLNEQGLHWGGENQAGINENGDYVFSVGTMTEDGSFRGGLVEDMPQEVIDGNAYILLHASRETTDVAIKIPIQPDGTAVIEKDSQAGKILFETKNGKAEYLGRWACAAVSAGVDENGVEQFNVAATAVRDGLKEPVTSLFETESAQQVNMTTFEFTKGNVFFLPPFLPISTRTPLERDEKKGTKKYREEVERREDLDLPLERDEKKRRKKDREEVERHEDLEFPPCDLYNSSANKELKELFAQRRSSRLSENPSQQLDHYVEAKEYIDKFSPEWSNEVTPLKEQAEPMEKTTRLAVCIPVAAHQEGENVYESLQNYTYQTADKESFEIVLFLNHPQTDKEGRPIVPDRTIEEVRRFKNDYPEMRIRTMYASLPVEEARIGKVRKLLNDATLMRHYERGKDVPDLIMASNDIDNSGVDKKYVETLIRKFDENPKVDSYKGQLDWDPESYLKYPVIHIGTRLFQYISAIGWSNHGSLVSSGANTAFRSSIYAGIGGYFSELSVAEDIAIGQAIVDARKESSCFSYVSGGTRIYTSSRRAIDALKNNLSPVEQWNRGFSAFDDEIRKNRKEEDINIDYDNPKTQKRILEEIQWVINRTVDVYESSEVLGREHPLYQKAIRLLGIKYHVENDKIVITDATRLMKGLQDYQSKALDMRNKRTGKA